MIRTLEAIMDEHGSVRLLEEVRLSSSRRALVTVLEEDPVDVVDEVTVVCEASLSDDWNRPEEDAAWFHLQPER